MRSFPVGETLTLLQNVRQGWKSLQEINTIAFVVSSDEEKKFYALTTDVNVVKHSSFSLMLQANKLERLLNPIVIICW